MHGGGKLGDRLGHGRGRDRLPPGSALSWDYRPLLVTPMEAEPRVGPVSLARPIPCLACLCRAD